MCGLTCMTKRREETLVLSDKSYAIGSITCEVIVR